MRKLFCCGALLAATGVASAYLGAVFVESKPDAVGAPTVAKAESLPTIACLDDVFPHPASAAPAEPTEAPSAEEAPAGVAEVAKRLHAEIVIGEREDDAKEVPAALADDRLMSTDPCDEVLMPVVAAETGGDGCPLTMSYCEDEGDFVAVMPHACDSPAETAANGFLGFWTSLFKSPAESPMPGGMEESEPGDGAVPQCKEDPAYSHQYPGCPHTGERGHAKTGAATKPVPFKEPVPEPGKPGLPTTLPYKPVIVEDEEQETPMHREVDTMEFRRSDAGFDVPRGPVPF
jgi:hypothetical protein